MLQKHYFQYSVFFIQRLLKDRKNNHFLFLILRALGKVVRSTVIYRANDTEILYHLYDHQVFLKYLKSREINETNYSMRAVDFPHPQGNRVF